MTATEVSHFVVGVVSKLDEKTAGRVKVKFPHLGMCESDWCVVVTPMGGAGRGFVMLPEVGDHVVVALEHGDVNRGYVLGAFWTAKQQPPELDGKPKENNLRLIRSRSGHQIRLDDTKGKERIEIIDKDGKRQILLDSAKKKIVVECDGDVDVKAESGNVSVKAESGNVSVKAGSGKVELEGQSVTVKSTGEMTIQAGGTLTLKGATVNIN